MINSMIPGTRTIYIRTRGIFALNSVSKLKPTFVALSLSRNSEACLQVPTSLRRASHTYGACTHQEDGCIRLQEADPSAGRWRRKTYHIVLVVFGKMSVWMFLTVSYLTLMSNRHKFDRIAFLVTPLIPESLPAGPGSYKGLRQTGKAGSPWLPSPRSNFGG